MASAEASRRERSTARPWVGAAQTCQARARATAGGGGGGGGEAEEAEEPVDRVVGRRDGVLGRRLAAEQRVVHGARGRGGGAGGVEDLHRAALGLPVAAALGRAGYAHAREHGREHREAGMGVEAVAEQPVHRGAGVLDGAEGLVGLAVAGGLGVGAQGARGAGPVAGGHELHGAGEGLALGGHAGDVREHRGRREGAVLAPGGVQGEHDVARQAGELREQEVRHGAGRPPAAVRLHGGREDLLGRGRRVGGALGRAVQAPLRRSRGDGGELLHEGEELAGGAEV